jgi:hypothetical protein
MSARDWIATYHVGANEPNAPVRRFDGDERITKTLIEWCRDEADEFLAALDAAPEATRLELARRLAAGLAVVDRSVLIEARDEITAYVKREYAGSEGYPSMERRMQRDLELARELGRLAAAKGGER